MKKYILSNWSKLAYIVLNIILVPYMIYIFLDIFQLPKSSSLFIFFKYLSYPVKVITSINPVLGPLILLLLFIVNLIMSIGIYRQKLKSDSVSRFRWVFLLIAMLSALFIVLLFLMILVFATGGLNFNLKT